jgi:hypothetical protein
MRQPRTDDVLINFSMNRARTQAWNVALNLASQSETDQVETIRAADRCAARLASCIRYPGFRIGSVLRIVRLGEPRAKTEILEILT